MPSLGSRDTQVWILNRTSRKLHLLVSPTPEQTWSGGGSIALEVVGTAPGSTVTARVPRAVNSARSLYRAVQELRQSALVKTAADLQTKVWWTEDLIPSLDMAAAWRAEFKKLVTACATPVEPGAAVRINDDKPLASWKALNAGYAAGVETCTSVQLTLVDDAFEQVMSFTTELDRSWLVGVDGAWRADGANLWRIHAASPELKSWDAGPELPTAPASVGSGTSALRAGQVLLPNQSLRSPGGQYQLVFQPDGDLVLYDRTSGKALWASMTMLTPALAALQDNGNLAVFHAAHAHAFDQVAWSSERNGGRVGPGLGAQLAVEDSGAAVVYGRDGSVLWSSATSGELGAQAVAAGVKVKSPNGRHQLVFPQRGDLTAALWPAVSTPTKPSLDRTGPGTAVLPAGRSLKGGEFLQSSNGQYRLVYQKDGNLALVTHPLGIAAWVTGTSGDTGQVLVGGPHGFGVYGSRGSAWAAISNGGLKGSSAPDRLVLEDRGELVLYGRDNAALWNSKAAPAAPAALAASAAAAPTAPAQTPSWQSQDVGFVSLAGSTRESGGAFTVAGNGADIWEYSDAFRYVYQPLGEDDCDVRARVASVGNTHEWAKVGLMVRENLTAGSRYVMAVVTPSKGLLVQARTAQDDTSISCGTASGTAPCWLRVTRSGDRFDVFSSSDGATWTPFGSCVMALGKDAAVGLAVTSHDATQLNTTTFDSVTIARKARALPAPWRTSDLGVQKNAGSVSLANNTFTVVGAGAETGGAVDSFRFVYQWIVGDCVVIARIPVVSGALNSARVGLMIRDSLDVGSTYAIALAPTQNMARLEVRATTGGSWSGPGLSNVQLPLWLRLVRSGNTFTASVSTDGAAWTQVGVSNAAVWPGAYVGLSVGGYGNSALQTAVFDSVSITRAASTVPEPWLTQDVGAVGMGGSATFANNAYSVVGAGADIWSTEDAFRFLFQPVSGNVEITARVVSQLRTNEWAKVGLMLRDSLEPNSVYALLGLTPKGDLFFHNRKSAGAVADHVWGVTSASPLWLRLSRNGNVITWSSSTNGVQWTQLGTTDKLRVRGSALVGLAVTSHETGALNTAVFDNVTVTTTSVTALPTKPSTLASNTFLRPGESLVSPNRQYELIYNDNGCLALYRRPGDNLMWQTSTSNWTTGVAPNYVLMQTDGNLVMFGARNAVLWSTGTNDPKYANGTLAVLDDGRVVIRGATDTFAVRV
ncbi:MAG: hypothetical protein U0326_08995 [Polyangiales bacterium]